MNIMRNQDGSSKRTSNKPAILVGTILVLSGTVLPLHADFAYIPAGGRVSQVLTETGQRQVFSGWNLPSSGFVSVDPTTGDLYTADQDDLAVYRINRTNGVVTFVSGPGVGSGPAFTSHVYGIVVETNGNPVVVDGIGGLLAVIRVDAHTGNRVVLSAGSNSTVPRGSGASFQSPFGIAIESTGNFLVTDINRNAVIRVDRVSGNRTLLSGDPFGDNVGTGPDMSSPMGIAIRSDDEIFVYGGAGQLMKIDPVNGNRTTISSSVQRPAYGLALGTNGIVAAAYELISNSYPLGGKLLGINPVTSAVTTLSCAGDGLAYLTVGAGPSFYQLIGITVDASGLFIVSDVLNRSLFVVDPTTGNRSVLPGSRKGSGTDIYDSKGIALGTSGCVIIVDDGDTTVYQSGFNTIANRWPLVLQVEPNTGDRSILSAGSNTSVQRGSGSNFDSPRGVARESSGSFVVADSGSSNPKVVRVDPATGNRSILSSSSVGTGTNFVSPYGIAVENSGSFIVTDTGLNAVLRVDPATGNRTVLSGSGMGTGPAFSQLRGVAVLQDGTIAVTDANLGAVLLVSGSTGNRVVLSGSSVGTGPTFTAPCGISGTWQGDLLVIDNSTTIVFKVNQNTGNRTVVSSASIGSGPCIESSPEFLATAPSLELASPQRLVGGVVQFNVYSPMGKQCVIEVSSNLTAWIQLTNFTTISNTNSVTDPGAVSQQKRFYRAHFTP
jgi:streptogramin lyase